MTMTINWSSSSLWSGWSGSLSLSKMLKAASVLSIGALLLPLLLAWWGWWIWWWWWWSMTNGHDKKLDAADTRSYLSPSSFTFSNKLLKGDESIMVLKIKPVQVFVMKESKKKFYGWMLTTIIFTYIRHKSPCQRCRPDAQSRHCSA